MVKRAILPAIVAACAAAAPGMAQSRDELLLAYVTQKLDLGTVALTGEAVRDPGRITFADHGYTEAEIDGETATLSGPDLVWIYTLRLLEDSEGLAICLRLGWNSRQYVQGAWRLGEDPDGYLRAARFNSGSCHNIFVTGQRLRRRGFVIPAPREFEAPPRFLPAPGAPLDAAPL